MSDLEFVGYCALAAIPCLVILHHAVNWIERIIDAPPTDKA